MIPTGTMPGSDRLPGGRRGDEAPEPGGRLIVRGTADGSPSLWSEAFGEGFHCGAGALAEARTKYVRSAQLERYAAGRLLRVVDVGVGLGYNSAALHEAALERGLRLQWWGLELDARPLALALAQPSFRKLWRAPTLDLLEQLRKHGRWQQPHTGEGRWLLGDARRRLPELLASAAGSCDLVLLDAFSPGRCPQLWTLEVLTSLAALLKPRGRLLTYCSAAAVRQGLRLAGLQLASICDEEPGAEAAAIEPQAMPTGTAPARTRRTWSLGTAASHAALPCDGPLRPLTAMEREHLTTRAAEPYRDPGGCADAATILAARRQAQVCGGGTSTSAWRRRWGLEPGLSPAEPAPGRASAPPPAPAAPPDVG